MRTFKEADVFPEARTLLAATAEANNRNACDAALRKYKREMDQLVGPGKAYARKALVEEHHAHCRHNAVGVYVRYTQDTAAGMTGLH